MTVQTGLKQHAPDFLSVGHKKVNREFHPRDGEP